MLEVCFVCARCWALLGSLVIVGAALLIGVALLVCERARERAAAVALALFAGGDR